MLSSSCLDRLDQTRRAQALICSLEPVFRLQMLMEKNTVIRIKLVEILK